MLALVNVLITAAPLLTKHRPERILYNMVRPFYPKTHLRAEEQSGGPTPICMLSTLSCLRMRVR